MTYCTNCGAANQETSQFCTRCGRPMPAASGGGGTVLPPDPNPAPTPLPAAASPVYTPSPGPPLQAGVTYAAWGDRVVGYLIDSLLVGAGMAVLYLIAGTLLTMVAGLGSQNLAGGMCCMMIALFPIGTFLVGLFNRVYLVAKRGSSIGQGVMKLKVVDVNGNLLTMGTALIRLLAQVALSFVPVAGPLLDLLWPLWDEKRQTLHDKAVGSFVLKVG